MEADQMQAWTRHQGGEALHRTCHFPPTRTKSLNNRWVFRRNRPQADHCQRPLTKQEANKHKLLCPQTQACSVLATAMINYRHDKSLTYHAPLVYCRLWSS